MAAELHAKLLEHLQAVLDAAAVPKETLSAPGLLLVLVTVAALCLPALIMALASGGGGGQPAVALSHDKKASGHWGTRLGRGASSPSNRCIVNSGRDV